ncbi:ABC transporter permease [Actinoplanes cyaneus]|uniref:ABC transporter permease n=1 Tax=Actinoplanes cyaneus TaxID=52696 RepID=A0A919ISN3_9ACTN|nr:ABC-2 family transporter protein [Actinoplanes cyaneus]MCW2144268.1 ABC-2 type transport system permease protein [Actinoplanes cyaneus]GID71019.1 ABC transporter permease [Actinoplanes cyaneus]
MRLFRLLGATFSLALRRSFAHRVNFVFDVAQSVIGIVTALLTTLAVYHQTSSLAGWSRAQALVLIGIFAVVSGVRAALIEPSLSRFVGTIRDGTLDEVLLRPAPTWFSVTCREQTPLALGQTLLGLGILITGVAGLPYRPGPAAILVAVVLIGCAVALSWAFSLVVASLGFWAGRFELAPLTASLWDVGRYPAGVYGRSLQTVLTYVIPLAGMITLPAQALTGHDPVTSLVAGVSLTVGLVALALLLFRRGLRRYTGATS